MTELKAIESWYSVISKDIDNESKLLLRQDSTLYKCWCFVISSTALFFWLLILSYILVLRPRRTENTLKFYNMPLVMKTCSCIILILTHSIWFHSRRIVDGITKQTISWHFSPNDTAYTRTCFDVNGDHGYIFHGIVEQNKKERA